MSGHVGERTLHTSNWVTFAQLLVHANPMVFRTCMERPAAWKELLVALSDLSTWR